MAEISINGTTRTNFGKGASRRDRKAGLVPAVIYGHGAVPQHVSLPAKEMGTALKTSNVLLDINFDGKVELTLPKSVTKHPITGILEHIDLLVVRRGEKVTVEVPIHTTGEHDRDGILEHVNNSIEVEVEATSIPSFIELSIQGMASNTSKYAGDVILPAGTKLVSDPHMIVVHLSEKSTAAEETPVAAVETAATPAAPAAETK
ncbi:MAG: 50S ribosomal protein L25/general stress protein Ctc [Actinomycetes bacterium]|jgi:large subunit ribosomal protein L25